MDRKEPQSSPEVSSNIPETADSSKQPAAIDTAREIFKQRYAGLAPHTKSFQKLEEGQIATQLEAAHALGLSDTATWDEIKNVFMERDREHWRKEAGIENPDATFDEIENTKTRDEWEEYAWDKDLLDELTYTFDGLRQQRWERFVLRFAYAHKLTIDKTIIPDDSDYFRRKHQSPKYGLASGQYADAVERKMLNEAQRLNINTDKSGLLRRILDERIRRRRAEALGNPALTIAEILKPENRKTYAALIGLKKTASWDEIDMRELDMDAAKH